MGENPSKEHPLLQLKEEAEKHVQEEVEARKGFESWQPHYYTLSIVTRMIARQIKIAEKCKDEIEMLKALDIFRSPSCPKVFIFLARHNTT